MRRIGRAGRPCADAGRVLRWSGGGRQGWPSSRPSRLGLGPPRPPTTAQQAAQSSRHRHARSAACRLGSAMSRKSMLPLAHSPQQGRPCELARLGWGAARRAELTRRTAVPAPPRSPSLCRRHVSGASTRRPAAAPPPSSTSPPRPAGPSRRFQGPPPTGPVRAGPARVR